MKLSILIPTHCRPNLFIRCLDSVLAQNTNDIEIIVNNDSNDIKEISHPLITYHYNRFENLSLVYKFLLEQSTGDYVYFLEDDDYLANNILNSIKLDADLIAGNYIPMYNPTYIFECMKLYNDNILTPKDFVQQINFEHLQLSQYIFKRSSINDFVFPMDNNVHNDINLVLFAASKSKTIRTYNKIFYHQTIDGGDNISFRDTKKSISTTQSMDFLKHYKELLNG